MRDWRWEGSWGSCVYWEWRQEVAIILCLWTNEALDVKVDAWHFWAEEEEELLEAQQDFHKLRLKFVFSIFVLWCCIYCIKLGQKVVFFCHFLTMYPGPVIILMWLHLWWKRCRWSGWPSSLREGGWSGKKSFYIYILDLNDEKFWPRWNGNGFC